MVDDSIAIVWFIVLGSVFYSSFWVILRKEIPLQILLLCLISLGRIVRYDEKMNHEKNAIFQIFFYWEKVGFSGGRLFFSSFFFLRYIVFVSVPLNTVLKPHSVESLCGTGKIDTPGVS